MANVILMVFFVYAADPDDTAVTALSDSTYLAIIWVPLAMLVVTAVTFDKKKTSFPTWYCITWLDYARWLGLINTSMDSNLLQFYKSLITSLNGIQIITTNESTEIFTHFSELSIKGYNFINNTEKAIFILGSSVLVCGLFSIFSFCSLKLKSFTGSIWRNLLVRSFFVCVYDFWIFGLLQIYYITLSTSYGVLNSVLAVVLIVISIIVVVSLPIYVNNLQPLSGLRQPSTLLDEFCYKDSQAHQYYYFIFLIKRLVSAIAIVFLQSFPIGQVIIISLCLVLEITYLAKYKPYSDPSNTYYSISAEVCQLITVVCIGVYIGNFGSDTELFMRWTCFTAFWVGTFICIGRFFVTLLKKSENSADENTVMPNANVVVDSEEEKRLERIRNQDLLYKVQVENVKEVPMEFIPSVNKKSEKTVEEAKSKIFLKAKTQKDQERDNSARIENARRRQSQLEENRIEDLTQDIVIPRSNLDSRLSADLSASDAPLVENNDPLVHSGIPYYSKLASKYTRGFTKNFK